jgi:hypothetical protein
VVEDTPLLTQSLPELQEKITTGKTRPPTRQSACQRRSHFLRWKFLLTSRFFLRYQTIMSAAERQEWSIRTSCSEAFGLMSILGTQM